MVPKMWLSFLPLRLDLEISVSATKFHCPTEQRPTKITDVDYERLFARIRFKFGWQIAIN